jgi:hypothetical protein
MRKIAAAVALGLSLSGAAHADTRSGNIGIMGNAYIFELYSNADGSVQFLMLSWGSSVRPGQTLAASNGSAEHSFVIPSSVPGPTPPITLIGTQSFADLKLVTPDFVVPDGFLFLTNGSVRFGPVDTSYSALPSDDVTAFWGGYDDDDGYFEYSELAVATNSSGAHLTFGPGVSGINALIEYHSIVLDDYFLTALPHEIEALDSGTPRLATHGLQRRCVDQPRCGGSEAAGRSHAGMPALHPARRRRLALLFRFESGMRRGSCGAPRSRLRNRRGILRNSAESSNWRLPSRSGARVPVVESTRFVAQIHHANGSSRRHAAARDTSPRGTGEQCRNVRRRQ